MINYTFLQQLKQYQANSKTFNHYLIDKYPLLRSYYLNI